MLRSLRIRLGLQPARPELPADGARARAQGLAAPTAAQADTGSTGAGRRLVGSAVVRGAGIAVSLALNLLLAAQLDPASFGAYAFIVALFNLAMVGCVFATDLLLTRHAHALREPRANVQQLLAASLVPTAMRAVLCWGLLVAGLNLLWSGPLVGLALYVALLPGLLAFAWLHIVSAWHRARGNAVGGSLAVFFVRPAVLLAALIALVLAGKAPDIATVIWFYLGSGIVALWVATRGTSGHAGAPAAGTADWAAGQQALGWSTLATNVFARSDSLILPALLSPTQFGLFALGRYVLDAGNRLLQLINVQLGPELVVKHRAGGTSAMRRLYAGVAVFGTVALGTTLMLWLVAGERFLSAYTSFPPDPTFAIVAALLAWGVASAAIGPAFLAYKVLGAPRTILQAQLAIGVASVIAYVVMTWAFGLWGAVAALIGSAAAPQLVAAGLFGRHRRRSS